MNPHWSPCARLATAAALLSLLCLAAGCASDDGPRRAAGPGGHHRPFPTMAGHADYFDGGLLAEIRVGAMAGFEPGGGGGGPGGTHGGRPHRGGGGMSMGGGGMGMGMGGGGGGRHRGDGEGPGGSEPDPDRTRVMALQRADAGGAPPVMIHLRFTNQSAAHVDLEIVDFLSPLGNFVIEPGKLSLEPGQSIEVEPMTSRLAGDVSGGEIKLSLRRAGATETQVVTLAVLPEPAVAPPDAAPQP
jgi:hypothetical protein